ncbi:caspase family protein [Kerstersia sp.]|uniref:caspase family protein n=1 Tax=Kerstersia sp. TaxID=1930783 RepID=UPI003F93EEC2
MKRKALLIGAPGNNGDKDDKLPGVNADLENLRGFLMSPVGGGWYQSEIDVLVDPTRADVDSKLSELKAHDYSFVFFGGHGRHAVERNRTQLSLRPGVYIEMADLVRAGARKHTVIADACRVFHYEMLRKAADLQAYSEALESIHTDDSRAVFDQHLNGCSPGVVELYACDRNEGANEDDAEGGLYTSSLIGSGRQWGKSGNKIRVMSIVSAHDAAKVRVKNRSSGRQNPSAMYPRTTPHFPFAIAPRGFY